MTLVIFCGNNNMKYYYFILCILNGTKNSGWNSFGDQILYMLAMVLMVVCAHFSTILVRLVLRPKICCIIVT